MVFLFDMFSKFGSFLTRFRKKRTVIESLEDIDKQIKDFEKYKQKNEFNERKYIGALVLYSILFYILGAVFYYIYFFPKNLTDRAKTLTPFLISPILIYGLRRFLKWFFIKRTTYYAKKLEDLREEKKTILEDVKEKETYKKAREILERFGEGVEISITPPTTPIHNKTINSQETSFIANRNAQNSQKLTGTTLIHRNVRQLQHQQMPSNITSKTQLNNTINPNMNTTINKINPNTSIINSSSIQPSSISQQIQTQTLGPIQQTQQSAQSVNLNTQARAVLPRPIITPNRTFFDKLLDFIIGEGPNNRYALICKNCHFHNGMALKEEFEYIAFRCAYCLFHNEARKTKLSVPKLNNKSENLKTNNELSEMANSNISSSNSLDDIEGLSETNVLFKKIDSNSNLLLDEKKTNENDYNKISESGDAKQNLNNLNHADENELDINEH